MRCKRSFDSILGLSYKDIFGLPRNNAERPMKGPDEFPWHPFHRVPVEKYLRPSFFGKRTAVHHASIGCPFNCSFCGVHAAYGNKERMESPSDWPVEGLLVHATGQGASGFRVVDVWESEEAWNRFGEVLGPVLQEVGIEAQPEVYPAQTFVSA